MGAKRGIFVAPFDELFDPNVVVRLAARAEERGWDGFFVWDHIRYSPPASAVADPWVTLAAVASATERLRLGPLVTPLSRRRVHKVARETLTLDALSGGRLVLGVGLGSDNHGELEPFGEVEDPRERARMLDTGLRRLSAYWGGELDPPPVQQPRIPVWVAGRWPARRPVRRAARWDGLFPIDLPGPEALAELISEVRTLRTDDGPFDFVAANPSGVDPAPWEAAGATWCLTEFGPSPVEAEVRAEIDAGPRR
jgi:alkanesulfonate monooxygenase SsuD/methylene tetrahydromethanopterin reductase-like flavin-dependent oxidoreductase (luciferase family)